MVKDNKENFLFRNKKKLITLFIIIAVAWLLGQWIVPALMKTIFL